MAILLHRIDPLENINRWYLVSVQATLFHPCAIILAWGRRDNDFQQWRVLPVDTCEHAQEIARRIIQKKLRRGYYICPDL